jgi:ABC-type multidrug transport system permease subunit
MIPSVLAGTGPIFWRELQIFRLKLLQPTYVLASMVTPLFYMLVFGLGLGRQVRLPGGEDYLSFLVPGLMGMAAMSNSFTWVASNINFARFYYRTWQLIILSPTSAVAIVAGNIGAGVVRGLTAASLVGLVGIASGWRPAASMVWPLALVLETIVFSAFGVVIGVITKKSEEHSAYGNFLITPMGFFCGTFFPIANFPPWLGLVMQMLPLTHASLAMREPGMTVDGLVSLAVLVGYAIVLAAIACWRVAVYHE